MLPMRISFFKLISDKLPTVSEWLMGIFDFLSLEYFTYGSKGEMDMFYQTWNIFINLKLMQV